MTVNRSQLKEDHVRNEYLELLGRVHQEQAILQELHDAAVYDMSRSSSKYIDVHKKRRDLAERMLQEYQIEILAEAWQFRAKAHSESLA